MLGRIFHCDENINACMVLQLAEYVNFDNTKKINKHIYTHLTFVSRIKRNQHGNNLTFHYMQNFCALVYGTVKLIIFIKKIFNIKLSNYAHYISRF